MDRRTYLRTAAAAAVPVTAGCLEATPWTAGDVELAYPTFGGGYYRMGSRSVGDPDSESIQFESLPSAVRVAVANAIRRGEYYPSSGRGVTDVPDEPIDFHGRTFEVGTSVADRGRPGEHGPDSDPDWTDPIDLDLRVTWGSIEIAISNALDVPLPVQHADRPRFGVLTAVGEDSVVLDHEHYESNDAIETDGPVRARRLDLERERTTLAPDESIEETYALPEEVPEDATVYLSALIGDESIDLLGNQRQVVIAHFSLRSD